MSRVYFHALHATAELLGSERYHLAAIARAPATAAWALEPGHGYTLERAAEIIGLLADEQPEAGRDATARLKAELAGARAAAAQGAPAAAGPRHRLITALLSHLRAPGGGLLLEVDGHRLWSGDIAGNQVLAAGPDTLRLAAKIDGFCETHGWIEGTDRAWMAGVIDQGLATGVYLRGIWVLDGVNTTGRPIAEHPRRRWSDQGWGEVLTLLRARADEPVVLGYSTTGSFPNPTAHPGFPLDRDKPPSEYSNEENDLDEQWSETWSQLAQRDRAGAFYAGVGWLRENKPWQRIGPDTLSGYTFGPGVTIEDLFAADRDERVRGAFNRWPFD